MLARAYRAYSAGAGNAPTLVLTRVTVMAGACDQTPDLKHSITTVLAQKDLNLKSDTCRKLQEFGKRLVTKLQSQEEADKATTSEFTATLFKTIDSILQEASKAASCTLQREKAWSKFHQLRCTSINRLWGDFLSKLNIFGTNALLLQSVTQHIFETKMKLLFPNKSTHSLCKGLDEAITENEKNIIMYACGYVPVTLIHRYEKRKGEKYASFVQCLLHMAIGTFEDTFYGYARKWFECVNRGGAFEVSDSAFDFFLVIKKSTRHALKSYLHTSHDQKDVVKKLILDEDILFHWSMLSIDLDDEESPEVLNDIITLWINIRGFSITGSWVEQQKKVSDTATKSKPGLRKGLKRGKTSKK